MPPDERVRADDRHGSADRREQPIQPHEKEAIAVREFHSSAQFPPQHDDLLPKCGVFRLKRRLEPERRCQETQEQVDQRKHR